MADRLTGKPFATRSEILAREGMVASSQPLATQAGLQILRRGGNAVDAAIAVNACLGLMEPTGCGIGGDLFVINWDAASGRLHGLNASGRSARGTSLVDVKRLIDSTGQSSLPNLGPLSVSVPGCVDGWFELNRRFGRLPMAEILAPAIHYAERGFPVSELIAHYWKNSMDARSRYPGFMETFTTDGHCPPAKGSIWRNSALAETYRRLAAGGEDVFYRGELARIMA